MKRLLGRTSWYYILIFCLVGIFFGFKLVWFLDPDFGWHLRVGELIAKQGIPRTDPFSFTMPSYLFVDHEWLTNVIIYFGYSLFGSVFLYFVFLILWLLLMWVSFLGSSKKWWVLPAILGSGIFLSYFGVRPQVQSWLLLSVLLSLLYKKVLWNKFRLIIPLFILFWTNLHGSFAVGIVVMAVVFGVRWVVKRRVNFEELIILGLSLGVTFINPYGWNIWREVWVITTDGNLRWTIQEWMPGIFLVDFCFSALAVLSLLVVYRYRKAYKPEELVVFLFFLIQGLLSRRHIPLWAVTAIPIVSSGFSFFDREVKKTFGAQERLRKIYGFAVLGALCLFVFQGSMNLLGARGLREEGFYPKEAVEYLKQNKIEGRVFSVYGWGGYLIWKDLERKVFIDGRMPSWRREKDILGESNYVMGEYSGVVKGETDYKAVFEKYGVEIVLWQQKKKEKSLIDKLALYFTNVFGDDKHAGFDLIDTLRNDGWVVVYEDHTSIILKK